ncbi:hypothetical protein ACBP20_004974 [Escherichia coli]
MSQQNKQPVIPFEIGIQQVINKWKQWGWVYVYEQNGYTIYDNELRHVCNNKNIRGLVYRYIPDNVIVPVREDKFQAVVIKSLNQLPLLRDPYGEYHPEIPQRLIPEGRNAFVYNTCDVYKPTTRPLPDESLLIQTWLDIMAGLFPNQNERKRVIQYFAHALQKPMEKPSFALLITGAQGNGKSSMLVNVLKTVLGETYVTIFNNVSQLSTSIGAQRWGNRLYCFVDDFADQTEKTSEKLKSVITQTSATVKKLYCDEYTIPVVTRFVFISNEAQPIPFYDGHDRRYYAPAYAQPQNVSAQVDSFLAQLRDDEQTRDALYRYLMDYPIDDFNPHVPEETDTHAAMVGNSVSDTIQQLESIMQIEKPMFINRNWYQHMLDKYYGVTVKGVELDKQWKQVRAHLKQKKQWFTHKINTRIGRTGDRLCGLAMPGFKSQQQAWVQSLRNCPMQYQDIWLLPLSI